MLFLSGLVTYSYFYIYDLVIEENEAHLTRLAQSTVNSLTDERYELERYASIIASDLSLREYMFIVTEVGGDKKPLRELYDRNFASLPIDSIYIIDKNKNLLISDKEAAPGYMLLHFPNDFITRILFSHFLSKTTCVNFHH